MTPHWLADADSSTAWADRPWTDFADWPEKERCLVVLPIFGLADHGLGLPLDAEEIVGSALLRDAVRLSASIVRYRVLPPVRFALAPYPSTFFGLDPDTAHDLLREIAESVKAAGFRKLVFFNASPWNEELVDVASRDIRVGTGLQTFVVSLSGLGLDFHPGSDRRAHAQAVARHLLGRDAPSASPSRQGDVRDAGFRPGNYRQPSPLAPESSLDGAALTADAVGRLARLCAEIDARAPLGQTSERKTELGLVAAAPSLSPYPLFPYGYRSRYLPKLTRDELEQIPNRDRALVILPTGAIEQHGHHLPVGVDAILGQAWLNFALPKLPAGAPVYVAPPITYGKSNEHVGFPGTIFISARTLRALLLAAVTQLKALGFRHIGILNTHGGNSAVIVYTLREIQTTLGLRAGMINFPFKPETTAQEAEYGFHAGEWETALMLAAAPDLVKMDRATCEYPARLGDPGELRPENAPAIFSWISSDLSKSGVMGDATRATEEKGRHWMEVASTALAKRIAELAGSAI